MCSVLAFKMKELAMERVQFSPLICTLLSRKGICNFTMGGDVNRRAGVPVSVVEVVANLSIENASTVFIRYKAISLKAIPKLTCQQSF